VTETDFQGHYSFTGLAAGEYRVRVWPPTTVVQVPELLPVDQTITLVEGTNVHDVQLRNVIEIDPNTAAITPTLAGGGIPHVFWASPLTLTAAGCFGGTASYTILRESPGHSLQRYSILRREPMVETPPGSGSYGATIAPLGPRHHGWARVLITIACPAPAPVQSIEFDVYIDPSGAVMDTNGNPVEGAHVTLFRADAPAGPFTVVPEGSNIMSPANRMNPSLTNAQGHFGWDVMAGFYRVRAEKEGCVAAADTTKTFTETGVLTIPPPVTDLSLVLDCLPAGSVNDLAVLAKPLATRSGNPYTIIATFRNRSQGTVVANPFFRVTVLEGPGCPCVVNDYGGVGAEIPIDVGDGLWKPGEEFTHTFVVWLTTRARFSFFVDIMGRRAGP
jgi:hypothetical protein